MDSVRTWLKGSLKNVQCAQDRNVNASACVFVHVHALYTWVLLFYINKFISQVHLYILF